MSNLTRREILKSAAVIPFIGLGRSFKEPNYYNNEIQMSVDTLNRGGPIGWYTIRSQYRPDPTLPFAIKYLEEMQQKINKDVEFEYYFYEKKDGWCIKFHNLEKRKIVKHNPINIDKQKIEFGDGLHMPLIDLNREPIRPNFIDIINKNKNVIIIEYHNLINALVSNNELS